MKEKETVMETNTPADVQPEKKTAHTKKRILIVDDAAISLSASERALKDQYDVITINSGSRALRYLTSETPDLILLDIQMDEKDGLETLKEIRELKNGKDIPVMMLTSAHNRKSVIEASKLGVYGYILKPYEPDDLRRRIQKVWDKLERLASGEEGDEQEMDEDIAGFFEGTEGEDEIQMNSDGNEEDSVLETSDKNVWFDGVDKNTDN